MARELGHLGIDIAALSETRLSDEGQLEEIGGGYTFFWKGLPAGERCDYGIGLAIRTNLTRQLVELLVGISERLMTLRASTTAALRNHHQHLCTNAGGR